MNNQTNLRPRTFRAVETLEDRKLFAAGGFAVDPGASRVDQPVVAEDQFGQVLAPRLLGTWTGLFAAGERQVTTVRFIVDKMNGDGTFRSEVIVTSSDGTQATTKGDGVFYKRGFTLDFTGSKTFGGFIRGTLNDSKGIDAKIELTLAGRRSEGSIRFTEATAGQNNTVEPTRGAARRPSNLTNPFNGKVYDPASPSDDRVNPNATRMEFSNTRIA